MQTSSRAALLAMAAMASLGSLSGGARVIGIDEAKPGDDRSVVSRILTTGGRLNGRLTMMRELDKAITMGFGLGSRGSQRRSGPGWTNAHAKRMAVKARNVKRHRASSRG